MLQGIEHTGIMVKNMEESLRFYCEVLGFSVRLHSKQPERELAFIYLEGNSHVEIELVYLRDEPFNYEKNSIVNHVAFRVTSIEDIFAHIRAEGFPIEHEEITTSVQGNRMTFFHGPNDEYLQFIES